MSQADPFREIVKKNIELYRASEDARENNSRLLAVQMASWQREYEIYVRAAKCFAMGQSNVDLKELGIFDVRSLEKHVDESNDSK